MSLKPYSKYKESGVEWVGRIPQDWNIERLSWLFGTISSGTTPSSDSSEHYGGEINWVTTGELRESVIFDTKRKVTSHAVRSLPALRMYEPGTLLIAMYGATIGRLGILGVPATTNQACCAFSDPTPSTDSQFVYYALMAAKNHLIDIADGGGQPNINQDKLRSLRIGIPSLTEQHQIAEYLDRETAEIDAFIADQEELIILLNERRAATITQAITKGLDSSAPMKASDIEWLSQVPSHWESVRLKNIVSVQGGYMFDSASFKSEGTLPVVKQGDLFADSFSTYVDYEVPERFMISDNDLIVSMSGDFKSVLWDRGRAGLNQRSSCMRPLGTACDARWLSYWMPLILKRLQALNASTTIQNLSASELLDSNLVRCPISEQRRVADYLDRETTEIEAAMADAKVAISLSKERRAALISAAVTGKIDVRDAMAARKESLEGERVVQ